MLAKKMKSFDYFSTKYNLVFKGEILFSSKIGGLVTIISVFFFIAFGIYLGKELIYKENPFDNLLINFSSPPQNLTYNIPIAFLIQTLNGSRFQNHLKMIEFNSKFSNMSKDSITNIDFVKEIPIKMKKCNSSDFNPEVKDKFTSLELNEATCLNQLNFEIGGDFTQPFMKYIEIDINLCKNSTANNNTCNSIENSFSVFKNKSLFISLHHEILSYIPSYFSNSFKKNILEDVYLIDPGVCKRYYYFVQPIIVHSQQGFLFYTFETQTQYQFEYVKNDFSLNNADDNCLFKFIFQSSYNTRIHTRTYITFSNVVAQVGGALNIYLFLFHGIFKVLYRRKMNEKIIRKLFTDHKENRNDEKEVETHRRSKFNYFTNIEKLKKHRENEFLKLNQAVNKEVEPNEIEYTIKKYFSNNEMMNNDLKGLRKTFTQQNGSPKKNIEFDENSIQPITKEKIQKEKLKKIIENEYQIKNLKLLHTMGENNQESEEMLISKIKFTLFQHFKMLFCSRIISQKLNRYQEIFKDLQDFSYRYLDIVNLVRKLHELERLKFVLFDKKQLSLFNNISQPSNPFTKNQSINVMAERLKFDNDHEAHLIMIDEIIKSKEEFLNDKMNMRLIKFYFNIEDEIE